MSASSLKDAPLDYTNYFSSFPTNVAIFENSSATIDCVVILNATTGRNVSVYWTKNDKNIDEMIKSNSRYQLSQERNKNGTKNFSLTIVNATVEDEGLFQCYLQFIDATDSKTFTQVTIESIPAYFKVEIEPTPPEIFPVSPVKASIGQNINLECKSAGRPRPALSWYDTNNKKILEGVTKEGEYPLNKKVTSNHLFPAASKLVFRVEAQHQMTNVTCVQIGSSSSFETRQKLKEMKVAIQIQVSPEIKIPLVNESYPGEFRDASAGKGNSMDYSWTDDSPMTGATEVYPDPPTGSTHQEYPESTEVSGNAPTTTRGPSPTLDVDSTNSSTSERPDYNSTMSVPTPVPAATEGPKEPVIEVYDGPERDLAMQIGFFCAGVFLVVIFMSLLLWYCIKYRRQGDFNVTL